MRRKVAFLLLFFSGGISLQHLCQGPLYFWLGALVVWAGINISSFNLRLQHKEHSSEASSRELPLGRDIYSPWFLCVCLFLFGGLYYSHGMAQEHPLWPLEGNTVTVHGVVKSVQKKETDYYQMTMAADFFRKGRQKYPLKEKVLLTVSGNLDQVRENGQRQESGDQGDSGAWLTGQTIKFSGNVKIPSEARNPGAFDYRLYLSTKKIYTVIAGKAGGVSVLDSGHWPADHCMRALAVKKADFLQDLKSVMEPEAFRLLVAMLFGDTNFMEKKQYEDFQKNGISHILAVSGLHVGIVYGCLEVLMRKPRGLVLNLIILILLITYAALSGFSSSVVRAVFMITIYIGSKIWNRRYDFLCSISLCAFVLLLINPANLFAVGFQLSFLAVITLAIVMSRLLQLGRKVSEKIVARGEKQKDDNYLADSEERYEESYDEANNKWKKLQDGVLSIVAIQAGMSPATVYLFGYFSFGAFLLNTPAIALTELIIPMGMAMLPLSFFLSPEGILFQLGASMPELFIRILVFLNESVAKTKIGYLWMIPPKLGTLFFYYFTLFFLCSESFPYLWKKYGIRRILPIILAVFLICGALSFVTGYAFERSDIVFLDVGQGDAVHLNTPGGHNVLIDTGGQTDYDVGTKLLLPYLLRSGVRKVDVAIVTHLHQDHYGGLSSISNVLDFPKVVFYDGYRMREEEVMSLTGLPREAILYVAAGDIIRIEEGIFFEVLYPHRKNAAAYEAESRGDFNENQWSLVVKLHYGNHNIILTGDMEESGEKSLLRMAEEHPEENLLKADILKAGHHGSETSSSLDFLEAVSPFVSVISVGRNFYGHPSQDVMQRIKKATSGTMGENGVYRTDRYGAVLMDLDCDPVKIWTMCKELSFQSLRKD